MAQLFYSKQRWFVCELKQDFYLKFKIFYNFFSINLQNDQNVFIAGKAAVTGP